MVGASSPVPVVYEMYSNYLQDGYATNVLPVIGLIGLGWHFGRPVLCVKSPPKHAAASASFHLESLKGSRLGIGLVLGSG